MERAPPVYRGVQELLEAKARTGTLKNPQAAEAHTKNKTVAAHQRRDLSLWCTTYNYGNNKTQMLLS